MSTQSSPQRRDINAPQPPRPAAGRLYAVRSAASTRLMSPARAAARSGG